MRAHLLTIVCKFGSDRAIFGVVVVIPAKKFTDTRTDTQTDDRRRAIALAHSLNELKIKWSMLLCCVYLCKGLRPIISQIVSQIID